MSNATVCDGTCQICERVLRYPKGRMSLHGYNRPGHGFIVGRCRGAAELRYEESCDVLKTWIVTLGEMLTHNEVTLAGLDSVQSLPRRVPATDTEGRLVYDRNRLVYKTEMVGPAHFEFDSLKRRRRIELESNIDALKASIVRHTARVQAWKPAACCQLGASPA